jgi:hypothetical protein
MLGVGTVTILGDIEGFVVVEKFEEVGGGWGVDDGRGDELIHGFVGRGVRGIVEETGAAGGDGAGEEGYSDGSLLGDALKGSDQVCAFEILVGKC